MEMATQSGVTTAKISMGKNGRIVIPAAIRKAMGVNEGDKLSLRYDDSGLHFFNRMQALKDLQEMVKRQPISLSVDEFLEWRKQDSGDRL